MILAGLRATVFGHYRALQGAQHALRAFQLSRAAGGLASSSRAGFLDTLHSQIGPRPVHSWEEEWVGLSCEHFRMTRQKTQMDDARLAAHCRDVDSLAQYREWNESKVAAKLRMGWTRPVQHYYDLGILFRGPSQTRMRHAAC